MKFSTRRGYISRNWNTIDSPASPGALAIRGRDVLRGSRGYPIISNFEKEKKEPLAPFALVNFARFPRTRYNAEGVIEFTEFTLGK